MKIIKTWLILSMLAPACWAADTQALAEKLLELCGTRTAMEQGFEMGFKPALAQMKAHGLPDELINSIHEEANRFFAENFKWEEIKPGLAKLYTDAFNEAELNDMIHFYETPTGKKASSLLPQLMQQGAGFAMSRVQAKMPEFQRKVAGMVAEYQKKSAPAPTGGDGAPGVGLPPPSP